MRKIVISFLMLMLALPFISPAYATDKEITLGLAAVDLQHPFFVRMKEAGDVAAKDYGVKTTWQSAEGSLEKQVAIIENFINQKVDVVLVDPLDKEALLPVIKKATDAGIPVITMGNKVMGENYSTLYPDYENMSMVARALAIKLGEEGEVGMMIGARGNFVSDQREKGFVETITKEYPKIKIIGIQPTNWDTSKAADAAQTWLATYPDLKGICVMSDGMALAAYAVAQGVGRNAILYGGYDGDEEMHDMIDSGVMVMDVLTGAYRVGYWNIAVAARLAKGEKLPKDLYMPTYFITSDATAKELHEKGLKFDYIDTAKAKVEAKNYTEQLGPDKPSSAMTAGPME